ncbi:lipase maturation factor family protein [Georgenia thermotolerans]|uniref:Lipase maturation factor family protein n=1 Tax=Georgenia thermotolerans TaxID=527326 RepID=A0A7J5ULY3_9MICO|nr:lipase maturation factor family protein [Georgenia thermotolerans]KAE8763366.1 lipase maturation factor family protein [Georgenia thermotolerans]
MDWAGGWFAAENYDAARFVLQRGIALVYVIAFVAALRQFRPLLGEHGLLPVPQFVARVPARLAPSLFHWRYSDRLLVAVAAVGALVAAALVLGLPQAGPPWVPLLAFLLVWALYLSVVNVGQVFYSFGWESLLLEAGFLAAFLGSDRVAPPLTVIVLFRWLVFRLEFGAGMIKMRGDPCWRDLTCLYYHHETQPMPNPGSWFFHHLPRPLHKVEVAANHVTQLVVPFLLFAPQPVATAAAAVVVVTQGWLMLSGNFAWLNFLTMLLAFSAVGDGALDRLLPWSVGTQAHEPTPAWFAVVVLAVTALMVVLSYWPARNLVDRHQRMNASFNRWHLAGAYGAFGSITRRRDEVVVEGTEDDDPFTPDWHEYEFKGKPGRPGRLPRQWAPYHLRLDWGMWFLALGSPSQHRWFTVFLLRLLEADRPTLGLLRHDPFAGRRPRYVRARVFRYRFSTWEELRRTRQWWQRQERALLVAPQNLQNMHQLF